MGRVDRARARNGIRRPRSSRRSTTSRAAIVADDLRDIRQRYAAVRVPREIISFVERVPTPVDLGDLVETGV